MKLYDSYRGLLQRARRDPDSQCKREMVELAKSIFMDEKTQEELAAIIDRLREIESRIPGIEKQYSVEMKKAVQSGKYSLHVPYQVQHRYKRSACVRGKIYVLTAPSRRGECKLGYTTMSISKRCATYASKYGYDVSAFYARDVSFPQDLEYEVAASMRESLVSGLTFGDSREWYRCRPEVMVRRIEQIVSQRVDMR